VILVTARGHSLDQVVGVVTHPQADDEEGACELVPVEQVEQLLGRPRLRPSSKVSATSPGM
jgi:hypothetical protein